MVRSGLIALVDLEILFGLIFCYVNGVVIGADGTWLSELVALK